MGAAPPPMFGVNLAGGEGGKMPGSGTYPYGRYGYDYIYPNAAEFAYYKSKGFNLVRLPIKWERLQHTLNGPLTTQDIELIDAVIAAAHAQDIQVLIDLHNYNAYKILTPTGWQSHQVGSDGAVTYAHLQDFWTRIASRYAETPGIFGYDLMNEPGGSLANWQAAAQAAVDAIRTVDTNRWIVVEGVSWAGAQNWTANNDALHVVDPVDKLMYSAHSYWDRGYQNMVDNWKHDGIYASYAQENGSPTMGVECLAPFVNWIQARGHVGFVGEYGVPGTGNADSDLWNVVLDNALAYLRTNGIGGTYWTGGPWYGNYQLTCEPSPIDGPDRPQMSVLAKYAAAAPAPPFNPLAETIVKADNIHPLNQGSSWMGGVVPDANDTALWNGTVGVNSVLLGADLSWGGLALDAGHSGNVTVNGGHTLTLGAGGIACVPNVTLSLNCGMALAAAQTWTLKTGFFNVSEIDTRGHPLAVAGNSNKKFKRAIAGGGPLAVRSGTLTFDANAESGAPASAVFVAPGASLVYDKHTGAKTIAAAITLAGGKLETKGDSAAATLDTIAGDLTIAGADTAGGYSVSTVTLTPNSARNARLSADRLVRERHGVVLFRGTNLGQNSIASQTANNANIAFATAPDLVGGGGAPGTTTISIIPGVIGGSSTSDNGTTFLTYDATNGLRPLNTATEFATSITSGSTTANNIRLAGSGSLATVAAPTTINSLIIRPTGNSSIDGTSPLMIASGQIQLNLGDVSSTTTLNAPIDFGSTEGVFVSSYNRLIEIKGAISGSGGLTFCQCPASSPSIDCTGKSNSGNTYTGNTYVLGRLEVSSTFLPSGSRTGDVYVHGYLRLNQGGYNGTINGLFGGGKVYYGNSGTSYLTLGDNNADGDFTGSLALNSSISVTKIGSGTQRLAGNCTQTRTTTVKGGTLIADGSFICPFTVNTNAILRGMGMIDKSGTAIAVKAGGTLAPGGADGIGTLTVSQGNVVFESGARLDVVAGRKGHGALRVAGAVVGDVTVPLAVGGEGAGRWKVMEAASIEPLFVPTTPGVFVGKENGGTELWVRRPPGGAVVIVR